VVEVWCCRFSKVPGCEAQRSQRAAVPACFGLLLGVGHAEQKLIGRSNLAVEAEEEADFPKNLRRKSIHFARHPIRRMFW
jgi:hypothetical protein